MRQHTTNAAIVPVSSPRTIRVISTTLCGERDVDKVGDALFYCSELVDAHLVIWTGPGDIPDELYASASRTGAEVHFRAWRWTGSFADARNASLDFAREVECDWSVMVDADERIVCPDAEEARRWIAALPPEVTIVTAHTHDGSYTRERFFRGSLAERWYLRTHEAIDSTPGTRRCIPREVVAWSEILKTVVHVADKCERDLALLDADLAELPDGPARRRVLFYKGQTLEHMGRLEESIACYRDVAKGNAGEGAAWACFCAARNYLRLSPPNQGEAFHACHAAVQREPRMAEPYWLAGAICHDLGQYEWAIAYEKMAQVHAEGTESVAELGGFRAPIALREGPQQVIDLCREAIRTRDGTPPPALPRPRIEPVDTTGIHITVTSTALNAPEWAGRCIRSVREQRWQRWQHHYVACDEATAAAAEGACYGDQRVTVHVPSGRPPLLANLLPIWRSLPPDDVVVWLDGDDWLATDHALARVAEAHARGALVTYGSFLYADGRPGFAGPCGPNPRSESWRATHLKTFRAGLVQRVREADWRWPDGRYLDLAVDQAVMLPCLEMAGQDRAVYLPELLCQYNEGHAFEVNGSAEEKRREAEAVMLVRSRRPYERLVSL